MRRLPALALGFLSGFLALSCEILWYRACSFASAGRAQTFSLMLGCYLAGIALGALGARRFFREAAAGEDGRFLRILGFFIVTANVLGFLLVPAIARLLTWGLPWVFAILPVAVAAAGLGAVFPLIAHAFIPPDDMAGARVSQLYVANIAGSASGSLLTGLLLLDRWSLATTALVLAMTGVAAGGLILVFSPGGRPARRAATAVALGLGMVAVTGPLFDGLYEKLQWKGDYRGDRRFAHVIETRSGVITVDDTGAVFGGGAYDGVLNTSLENDRNLIYRAYAIGALHPAPREVLMIGLASGSWAKVVANHPEVERLTIVEINPGYLDLLARIPEMAGLAGHPKVRIEIDDGRRWLLRHPEARFDLIVANTIYHWRSSSTHLLSTGFQQIVRSHLKDGGIYYFNATGSDRALKTGAQSYPDAWRLHSMLAVSDAPIPVDAVRFRRQLEEYRLDGARLFRPDREADRALIDRIVAQFKAELESRESILARTADLDVITDDNMGSEWKRR